jgi:Uma2 family endonuclease
MTPDEIQRLREIAEQLQEFASRQGDAWKVEISEGRIDFVLMSPTTPRGMNVVKLRRQVEAQSPEVVALSDTGTEDPVTGLSKVPDLMAVAETDLNPSSKKVNSRDLLLVVEVVSRSNAENDLVTKLSHYPRMGVPVYVVVDARKGVGTVTVHSDPKDGPGGLIYRSAIPYAFGDTVTAGRWTLETTDLVTYPDNW